MEGLQVGKSIHELLQVFDLLEDTVTNTPKDWMTILSSTLLEKQPVFAVLMKWNQKNFRI